MRSPLEALFGLNLGNAIAQIMSTTRTALEFKGRMLSLTRVRILDADLTAIKAQLQAFTQSLGEAAAGMPVLLDADEALDLAPILSAMRAVGIQPMAVNDGALAGAARALGLPVMPDDLVSDLKVRAAAAPEPSARRPQVPPPATATERKAAKVITTPIRSGQQVYAEGSDLIVMTTVSPGAEVIADGCVHVYGALRGRAVAGAQGDKAARVFCKLMEAELIAVAGIYAVAEQINGALRGQAVQALLVDGKLSIEKLGI